MSDSFYNDSIPRFGPVSEKEIVRQADKLPFRYTVAGLGNLKRIKEQYNGKKEG